MTSRVNEEQLKDVVMGKMNNSSWEKRGAWEFGSDSANTVRRIIGGSWENHMSKTGKSYLQQ